MYNIVLLISAIVLVQSQNISGPREGAVTLLCNKDPWFVDFILWFYGENDEEPVAIVEIKKSPDDLKKGLAQAIKYAGQALCIIDIRIVIDIMLSTFSFGKKINNLIPCNFIILCEQNKKVKHITNFRFLFVSNRKVENY